jgi:hypothetical protein
MLSMVSKATVSLFACMTAALCQPAGFNYEESKAGTYTLPDALTLANGQPVKDAKTWREKRRPEILRLFESQMFGRSPGKPRDLSFELSSMDKAALSGKAVRKQVTVAFARGADTPRMQILLYLPAGARGPVPVFLGLNFGGNHTVHADRGITLAKVWRDRKASVARSRAAVFRRWQVDKILARGYGLATIYYGDIDPDFHDGFKNGVHPCSTR